MIATFILTHTRFLHLFLGRFYLVNPGAWVDLMRDVTISDSGRFPRSPLYNMDISIDEVDINSHMTCMMWVILGLVLDFSRLVKRILASQTWCPGGSQYHDLRLGCKLFCKFLFGQWRNIHALYSGLSLQRDLDYHIRGKVIINQFI